MSNPPYNKLFLARPCDADYRISRCVESVIFMSAVMEEADRLETARPSTPDMARTAQGKAAQFLRLAARLDANMAAAMDDLAKEVPLPTYSGRRLVSPSAAAAASSSSSSGGVDAADDERSAPTQYAPRQLLYQDRSHAYIWVLHWTMLLYIHELIGQLKRRHASLGAVYVALAAAENAKAAAAAAAVETDMAATSSRSLSADVRTHHSPLLPTAAAASDQTRSKVAAAKPPSSSPNSSAKRPSSSSASRPDPTRRRHAPPTDVGSSTAPSTSSSRTPPPPPSNPVPASTAARPPGPPHPPAPSRLPRDLSLAGLSRAALDEVAERICGSAFSGFAASPFAAQESMVGIFSAQWYFTRCGRAPAARWCVELLRTIEAEGLQMGVEVREGGRGDAGGVVLAVPDPAMTGGAFDDAHAVRVPLSAYGYDLAQAQERDAQDAGGGAASGTTMRTRVAAPYVVTKFFQCDETG